MSQFTYTLLFLSFFIRNLFLYKFMPIAPVILWTLYWCSLDFCLKNTLLQECDSSRYSYYTTFALSLGRNKQKFFFNLEVIWIWNSSTFTYFSKLYLSIRLLQHKHFLRCMRRLYKRIPFYIDINYHSCNLAHTFPLKSAFCIILRCSPICIHYILLSIYNIELL